MRQTVFQRAELRDENDNIIQQGTYGKGSALSNSTNDAWIDYVMNNLEALYGIAKDEVVPVASLPASGDMNKTYLLTTNGKTYRWSGTAWVELTNSEAVGRAEAAADLAEQWATKTSGTVEDNEYSAKHYSNVSKDWANKLNATVDGSEYSAKHYAGVAEGWAESDEAVEEGKYSAKHYAEAAAQSATNAGQSETNAADSKDAAARSAQAAAQSAQTAQSAAATAASDAATAAASQAAEQTSASITQTFQALLNAPYFGYDENGHLNFYYNREV